MATDQLSLDFTPGASVGEHPDVASHPVEAIEVQLPRGQIDAVRIGRYASGELDPNRAIPKTEDGLLDVAAVVPGMYDESWGAVRGRQANDVPSQYDIARAPMRVPRGERPLAAARHYAGLVNTRISAIDRVDPDAVRRLDIKIHDWLDYSEKQGWR
jgi:hypothetical protein